jgi:PAS domain S-box-containing protein
MRRSNNLVLLLALLTTIPIIVSAVTVYSLYRAGLAEQRQLLAESAEHTAHLIEAFAASSRDPDTVVREVEAAYGEMTPSATSLEMVIGKMVDGRIVFLFSGRGHVKNPVDPIPLADYKAEPMRRSLAGQAGTLIGPDYRGVLVLAAHHPVQSLGWGVVVKLDLAEVRAPYVHASLTAAGITILLVILGAVVFLKITNPIVRNLEESEQRFRRAFEGGTVGMALVNPDGRFLRVNSALCEIVGYSQQELTARSFREITHPEDLELRVQDQHNLLAGTLQKLQAESRYIHKDGHVVWVLLNTSLLRDRQGRPLYFVSLFQDITDRKHAEEKIRRLSRVHAVLGKINEIIVRERDQKILLDRACRAAVQQGEFRMAWIGMLDEAGRSVLPVAQAGIADGYVENLRIRLDDGPESQGPTGTALREGLHFICNDVERDPRMAPWRERALRMGYRSHASFPLKKNGHVAGAFNLYAAESEFFDDDEIRLLDELAADISFALESIELQEQIARNEKRLRLQGAALESAANAVMITDHDGCIIWVNPSFASLTGFTPEEVVGRNPRMLSSGQQDAAFYQQLWQTILSGKVWRGELINKHKDGTLYHEDISITPVHDPAGEIRHFVAIQQDITDRKKAEDSLRQSEQRYQLVVNNIREALVIDDLEGRIVFANDEFLKLFGVSREELPSMTREDYMAHEWQAEIMDHGDRRMRGERVSEEFELEGMRKDGTRLWLDVTVTKVIQNGKMIGAQSTIRDITERKLAVEALRQNEARYSGLLEAAPDAIVVVNRSGQIVLTNTRTDKMFGYTRAELTGQLIEFLIPARFHESHVVHRSRYFASPTFRELRHQEIFGQRKDGSEFPVEITLSHLDVEGETLVTAIVRDISDRLQLEAQLHQAQKMDAIGRLSGGIAHDFNNILTVILGYCDNLLKDFSLAHPQRTQLDEIKKAGERAAALTRQLLAFSRTQSLRPRVLDLNEVVTRMGTLLARLIGEDIEFATVLSPSLWRVSVDPSQIERVIMNLAVNARDAMPHGGKVTIETANVELGQETVRESSGMSPGAYVMLAVSDIGEGMDPETQARIFEPFFTTKELGKGTGLGLATVYGIIKQSGGFIWVYSEVGKGTTLKIYLPRVSDNVESEPLSPAPVKATKGSETILVVEDDAAVRILTCGHLKAGGYHVLEAASGPDAIEIARRHKGQIHLLLTDVVMPKMNGPELAAELAVYCPETKVLYVSGYTADAATHHGLLDAGLAFLEKPFMQDALLGKIREILG